MKYNIVSIRDSKKKKKKKRKGGRLAFVNRNKNR